LTRFARGSVGLSAAVPNKVNPKAYSRSYRPM
jgi:hypothetical protein